jgi:penicillin-binding protein 1C
MLKQCINRKTLNMAKSKLLLLSKYFIGSIIGIILLLWTFDKIFPLDLTRFQDTSTIVYGSDQKPQHIFLSKDEKWRLPTTVAEVSPLYIKTLKAREDRFYSQHFGINPFAILRASYQALTAGRIVSGGSTLTMQTARLLYPNQRTLIAKIKECFRALQLESHFTKNEILNMYLTLAPFGSNIEGVKAAANAYFNKPPNKLTISEVALLVALVQSPTQLRPDRYPEKAKKARQHILDLMQTQGFINANEAQVQAKEPIPDHLIKFPRQVPHLAWRLKQLYPLRSEIISTINSRLQNQVEYLLANYRPFLPNGANAAILIVDHVSNKPLVYVASMNFIDHEHQGFVDYIKAMRSPGSTLKPFIYGMSFDLGLTKPTHYVLDAQRRFGGYYPHNIDKNIHGMIEVKDALALSLNIPAVSLLNEIGVVRFLALLKQAGVEPAFPKSLEGPSLPTALGGLSLSLEQLVTLYGALANNGKAKTLYYLAEDNNIMETHLFSPRASEQVTDILTNEDNDGRKIALKTGTSYGHRDALALGYDQQYVVGIWIGKPNGAPMEQSTGSSVAVPLLNKIFKLLPKNNAQQVFHQAKDKYYKLQNLSSATQALNVRVPSPSLIFPVDDSVITLDNASSQRNIVPCKVAGGVRPFTWLINDQAVVSQWWQRQYLWTPEQPGYYSITVIDAMGQSAHADFEIKIS